jgi:hypothetical protein
MIPVGRRPFKCRSAGVAARDAKRGASANKRDPAAGIGACSESHGGNAAAGRCGVPQVNNNYINTLRVACGKPFILHVNLLAYPSGSRTSLAECNWRACRVPSGMEGSPVVSRHYGNKARRAFWVVHLEAWRQSGLSKARYCGDHRLNVRTFTRWLEQIVGEEAARKHVEYQTQRRREERLELKERERRARVPLVRTGAAGRFRRSGRCMSRR